MKAVFQSFSFRLTFWYAAVSFGIAVLGFAAVYFMLQSNMRERTDARDGADIRIDDLQRADVDTLEDYREISAAVAAAMLLVSAVGG